MTESPMVSSSSSQALFLHQLQQKHFMDEYLRQTYGQQKSDLMETSEPSFGAENQTENKIKLESQTEEEASAICSVCNDEASGRHYGAFTCFGCKGFFRRTVRANKVYTCRYEKQCQIDKVGRNICRSCRFRKCLEVGMEPDAIRPDRDKTGRQKNPRKSTTSMSSSKSFHDIEEDQDRKSPDSTSSGSIDDNLRSHCETMAPSSVALAQRDLVLGTLLQIENICAEITDDPKLQSSPQGFNELHDIVLRPSLLGERTPLDYEARSPVSDADALCGGLRRLVIMAIDYVNTLKPIADICVEEKIILVRSFVASFIVLTTIQKNVTEGNMEKLLLPNGLYIDSSTSMSSLFSDCQKDITWLDLKFKVIRDTIIEKLNFAFERLCLVDQEIVCLKALMALDPNVYGLSEGTAKVLNIARESVQNALYLYLAERYPINEAVDRFGKILMLLPNVSKTGALLSTTLQLGRDLRPDAKLLDLFSV
ncbi:unnamed protein product [Bursaphelenchus xylophilus]|uniref:(pine wood nematode) hypothetical protein n=1 Tax=Bursaphelenchus xylophilus TaxID=6326 RepID=A0A1I7RHD5_BURXY|nr:unnamed protein product [Bursaphelenchus xylophilus]CAG9115831.1 unnamed protein product [Bursaphelenchus xylophilus]